MRPEYNDKIIEANLLAPVAFLKGNKSKLYRTLLHFYKPLNKLLSILNINYVSGVSLRQGIHYVQLMRDGGFRQFDYDKPKLNKQHYGTPIPPDYDLKNVKTPVNLLISTNDEIAILENVLKLKSQLPNVRQTYIVPVDGFSHVDFIYSRFAPETINKKLISLVNKANKSS